MTALGEIKPLLPAADEWEEPRPARELLGWTGPDGDTPVSIRRLRSEDVKTMPEPSRDDLRFTRGRVAKLEGLLREFASGAWTDDTIKRANELLSGGA